MRNKKELASILKKLGMAKDENGLNIPIKDLDLQLNFTDEEIEFLKNKDCISWWNKGDQYWFNYENIKKLETEEKELKRLQKENRRLGSIILKLITDESFFNDYKKRFFNKVNEIYGV